MFKIVVHYSGNLVDTYKFSDDKVVSVGRGVDEDITLDALGVKKHERTISIADIGVIAIGKFSLEISRI